MEAGQQEQCPGGLRTGQETQVGRDQAALRNQGTRSPSTVLLAHMVKLNPRGRSGGWLQAQRAGSIRGQCGGLFWCPLSLSSQSGFPRKPASASCPKLPLSHTFHPCEPCFLLQRSERKVGRTPRSEDLGSWKMPSQLQGIATQQP